MRVLLLFGFLAAIEAAANVQLRVSPALGAHGRDKVRISIIDGDPTNTYGGFFDYNEKFQHKWTNNSLHSVLKTLKYGENELTIGSDKVTINLPTPGTGVRGIVFGDPCIEHTGFDLPCVSEIEKRLPVILNRVNRQMDFWTILGDNFYDRYGDLSARFFADLEQQTTAVPLITIPGNHDYWLLGTPDLKMEEDQYGNGFMQYYGQDAYASKYNSVNYLNFSVDPHHKEPAAVENFFQYKVVGNVGFIAYSAAYSWTEQESMFHEACAYMKTQKADWVWLMGHWSNCNAGCKKNPNMDVPATWSRVKNIPGCDIPTLKNMYGHIHCNKKFNDHQFEIGGTGFLAECKTAGFVYMSTMHDRLKMVLFPYGDHKKYTALIGCLDQNKNNLEECIEHGTVWYNATALDHLPFHHP